VDLLKTRRFGLGLAINNEAKEVLRQWFWRIRMGGGSGRDRTTVPDEGQVETVKASSVA
jgi:hypothetical protein